MQSSPQGLIFDIKRYAINDGPGIRVVVFFKGCNLHCAWCHNPEGISAGVEKMYAPLRCIRCGSCVDACPEKAIRLTPEGIVTDSVLCKMCLECAAVCPTRAIEVSGELMSVSGIIDVIEKERVFIDQSGGGVTFSGGEPLLHPEILYELLDECRKRGIHSAVDTAGHVNPEILLKVAQKTDLFLYDLKAMDENLHLTWTEVSNGRILQNLTILAATGARIIIRIPLAGGINDTNENIEQTAEFISGLSGEKKEVHLLPYHNIAQHKYLKLGMTSLPHGLNVPDKATLERIIAQFADYGIKASVGG